MPINKSPLEYYRYYCASQRRVEQWVQDTGLLQFSPAQPPESSTTQWRGFLEDPNLATPISRPLPLVELVTPQLSAVPEHDPKHYLQCPTPEIERLDMAHDLDNHSPRGRPPHTTTTTRRTHDDRPMPRRPPQPPTDPKPISDNVPPTSSKHSKDSKLSRHTSKSKNSRSSSSRKRLNPRKQVDIHRSIIPYVPYGIISLFLFAMTTGSSAVSLAAASIILAGYFCLDYTSTADKRYPRK